MAHTETWTDLRNNSEAERVELGDATLYRGYLYRVAPLGPDARVLSGAEYDGEGNPTAPRIDVGYHGTDVPPCSAEWLADDTEGDGGYLVISACEDVLALEVVDGWTVEIADDLEYGDCRADDVWRIVIVRRHGGHEYTVAGSL